VRDLRFEDKVTSLFDLWRHVELRGYVFLLVYHINILSLVILVAYHSYYQSLNELLFKLNVRENIVSCTNDHT
jgi:hypothetical protein